VNTKLKKFLNGSWSKFHKILYDFEHPTPMVMKSNQIKTLKFLILHDFKCKKITFEYQMPDNSKMIWLERKFWECPKIVQQGRERTGNWDERVRL
jgi:hypothetical protein